MLPVSVASDAAFDGLNLDGFAGVMMASLGSDLVFGFQVLFDLIILFFEGLGILDHFLGFLDQVGGTVWVTEPKAL